MSALFEDRGKPPGLGGLSGGVRSLWRTCLWYKYPDPREFAGNDAQFGVIDRFCRPQATDNARFFESFPVRLEQRIVFMEQGIHSA